MRKGTASHHMFRPGMAFLAIAASSLMAGSAFAEDGPIAGSSGGESAVGEAESGDIVVTGTLVRGIAPAGTNVIGVSSADIQETGATTTAQLLQTIPQLGSFSGLQFPSFQGNAGTVNRPNIRSFAGASAAGGSTTLVLLDGRRVVGMGVNSTTPDPDVIPPGAIERVEIIADGGSALYGSDAVAGILNFITRKRFDGVKVDGHYGFADNYYQYDASVTAGKDWGSGSLYFSYNFAKHSDLLGSDRDYIRQFPNATGGLAGITSIECAPGTITIGSNRYRLSSTGAVLGTGTNQCDVSDTAAFYPKDRRHSVMASLYQELSDTLDVEIKAFYTNRRQELVSGPFRATRTVTASSPFFAANRIGAETSQSVSFAFGPDSSITQPVSLKTWGVASTFTKEFGGGWRVRLLGNVGESDTTSAQRAVNVTALDNAIAAGFINPYAANVSTGANYAAAIAAVTNYEVYGRSRQFIVNTRVIADGDLFDLPGGAVKLAAGAEYLREHARIRVGSAIPGLEASGLAAPIQVGGVNIVPTSTGPALPLRDLSRGVKSVFGELVVPIFGADNAMAGFREVTLSVAGRYDHYSDFGGTFNPKFGLTWKPTEWLKLRGSYGKSFNAPSLADAAGADVRRVLTNSTLPTGTLITGGLYPAPTTQSLILISRGNSDSIGPQKASTISAGFDITPQFDTGLRLSLTYFNAKLDGTIFVPPLQNGVAPVYRDYRNIFIVNPTQAQIDDFIAYSAPDPVTVQSGAACPGGVYTPGCVYALLDARKQNLGKFQIQALDLNIDWSRPTSFGALTFNFNGTYELSRKEGTVPGQPLNDRLAANQSRYKFRTSLGAEIGEKFFGQATLSHNAGYQTDPVVGLVPQDYVDSFTVVDLFFRYDFKGDGALKDTQLTMNVNNLFNRAPPEYRGSASGVQGILNGSTLGRLVQFGISKRF